MTETKTHQESDLGTILVHTEGMRPIFLASMETTNPHARALSETIFWSDQLREHAQFMEMFLPVESLPSDHERAAMFKGALEVLYEKALMAELEPQSIDNVCDDFLVQAQGFRDFQRDLLDRQLSAKIHTLMWPTLLDHLIHETDRYTGRISIYQKGQTVTEDRDEVITFWSQIMAEHAQFVAHLLDPVERDLFMQALKTSDRFWDIKEEHALEGNRDPVTADIDSIINFKTAALNGIKSGKIHSIISPVLADHVRREAVLFGNELRRADLEAGIQPLAA